MQMMRMQSSRVASRRAFTASRTKACVCRATSEDRPLAGLAASALAALTLSLASPSYAEVRLPPIDKDPNRCERGFTGNTIGQANGVADKILDLRNCSYVAGNLSGKTLSGALMVNTDMSKANLRDAVLTKAYAIDSKFEGADMTNAVIDRVAFDGANLKAVNFTNAVVTGTTFEAADLTGSVWEDAIIGKEDAKRLCANPTLTGESRSQVGCRT